MKTTSASSSRGALALLLALAACGSAPATPTSTATPAPTPIDAAPRPAPADDAAVVVTPPQLPIAAFPARTRGRYEALGDEFMIVSQGDATTRAARRMFELGGNAIDAAAAATFAISVERPQSTGLAGGGFLVARLAEAATPLAVDFREQAPAKAHRDMFLDATGAVAAGRSTDGGLASGVPGVVAGILEVHAKHGKLPRATVVQPAIDLAEQGLVVYEHLAAAIRSRADVLWASPAGRALFFHAGDRARPLAIGDRLVQRDLGRVLREIAKQGRKGFYAGWVAKALVAEQRRTGGTISAKDLSAYQVRWRAPVGGDFGPYQVLSMPPPSSGGAHVVEILNILEPEALGVADPFAAAAVHRTATAMQMAYFDRATYLGDADFVDVPLAGLTSQTYADAWRARFDPARALHLDATPVVDPRAHESSETTHFTIADRAGNVIASTQTINGWFGSGVVVAGTGLVMNNEMDDFSAKPGAPNKFGVIGGEANAIAPRKRPLSSMSPTIVLRDGQPVLALGSPAGSQIITCVALTILTYLGAERPLWDAVTAVRYHHQWTPDQLVVEAPGLPPATEAALRAMGHDVQVGGIGCKVQAIAYEPDGLRGVSDPRGEGLAAGEDAIPEDDVAAAARDTVAAD